MTQKTKWTCLLYSHPRGAEYTFFSSTHRTFSRTDHMLGHKTSQQFKIKIILAIFSNHSGMNVEINDRKQENSWTHGNWTIHFFKRLFILFIWQRQPAREGTQAGGVGEEEAGSQWRSLMWGSIPEHWDHALSRKQMLNDYTAQVPLNNTSWINIG